MDLKKKRVIVFVITVGLAVAILAGTGLPLAQNAAAAFAPAAFVSFLVTPFVRRLAYRINAMDVPQDARRMHDHPVPRIGGLAIILGFAAGAFFSMTVAEGLQNVPSGVAEAVSGVSGRETLSMLRGMLPGALIIAALGFVDDLRTLGPWPKLAVQVIAALMAVCGGNVIEAVSGIFNPWPYQLPRWIGVFLSVLWIVGVTNAVNLIDGLDGLACGISAISSGAAALAAGFCAASSGSGMAASTVLPAAALAGACIGFLPYNLCPARIFMGDTGATFLGYILAVLSIRGLFRYPEAVPFAVPCLILGLPVFDTCFAVVRRAARGRSPLRPDRGHVYHRLLDHGVSKKQTTAFLWVVSADLSILAFLILFLFSRDR